MPSSVRATQFELPIRSALYSSSSVSMARRSQVLHGVIRKAMLSGTWQLQDIPLRSSRRQRWHVLSLDAIHVAAVPACARMVQSCCHDLPD
jgi:hypothetical protein